VTDREEHVSCVLLYRETTRGKKESVSFALERNGTNKKKA
jgi:hypothetical protein